MLSWFVEKIKLLKILRVISGTKFDQIGRLRDKIYYAFFLKLKIFNIDAAL